MKKALSAALLMAMTPLCTLMAQKTLSTEHGVYFETKNGDVKGEVMVYSPEIVRVMKYPGSNAAAPEKKSLSVIMQPAKVPFTAKAGGAKASLKTSALNVDIDAATGAVRVATAKGKVLLAEKGNASFNERTAGADKGAYEVGQTWTLSKDECIYGLGILQDGKMNRRNTERHMVQGNTEDFVNIVHSSKGYGLFWDNYSPTDFTDNAAGMNFRSEVGDMTDYYVVYGGNADGVISQMRTLTGKVPMAPMWAYGFMQSRERYKSTDELLEVFRRYRTAKIPVDCMIQDWQYWGSNYTWNAMEFISEQFSKADKMIEEVHKGGGKVMISVWSSFGPMTKQYREMDQKGMLFDFSTWPQSGISHVWPPVMEYPSGVRVYDAYNSEARDMYWRYLSGLHKMGLDGWWMDSTEPDHLDAKDSDLETKTAMGSFRKVRNAYPLMTVGGVYDHQRAVDSDKRVFILTRSVFAGQQRTGANTWSGDTNSSWKTLRNQVVAGLNFSLTGNPNYNSDLGGFFANSYGGRDGADRGMNNPLFRELYVRWLQQGVFTPMMRSHGESFPREFYYYGREGQPVYDALVEAVQMRYRLLPYTYSTAYEVSQKDGSFMRALMMDFPGDAKVMDMGEEFMYGREMLVAPVLHAQYTTEEVLRINKFRGKENDYLNTDFTAEKSTEVYLPKGAKWYDFWTNEAFAGGKSITKATHLNTIPLYIKAGSIVPLAPVMQYSNEKPWDDLEVRVYAGADGEFTLYEDEGDNYNYEKGKYTTITFQWNDKANTLTIGDRKGQYPGMLEKRTFNVIVIKDGKAAPAKPIEYKGKAITL